MPAYVVMAATAVSTAFVLLWWRVAGDRQIHAQASGNLGAGFAVDPDVQGQILSVAAGPRLLPFVWRAARRVTRRCTPTGALTRMNRNIAMAGMTSRWSVERLLGVKTLLGGTGLAAALALAGSGSAAGIVLAVTMPPLLFLAPDLVVRSRADRRQSAIRLALPDTLDQITICAEAGLAFDAAVARAARTGKGPLAEELLRMLQDVQLGMSRRDAMMALSERSAVEEIHRLVQVILQADIYGIPIAHALRVHAAELRDKRRQLAEERAMKVSVKMILPLAICILPTLLIVIVSPAIFRLVDGLQGGMP
jgi:tight adherence protein C